MRFRKTYLFFALCLVIVLFGGIVIGYFMSGRTFGGKLYLTPHNKISVILDFISQEYVDTVEVNTLTENAISNIIKQLDPHSTYFSEKELQSVNEQLDGYFGGIGVTPYLYNDTLVVMHVTHGGPASQAGIMPGDRCVLLNDSILNNITQETILNKIRGPIGSSLKLGIKRNNSDSILNYDIVRGEIPITTIKVATEIYDGIGVVKIYDNFSNSTYDEFIKAVTKLTNAGCSSFIIDLRMNGGGLLNAAIKIANEFLPAGSPIVYAEGKSFPKKEYIADGLGNFPNNKVVVLMDQISASASEVLAGALQDNDRAWIIGRRSFGKGLIQSHINLSDNSALRLTVARYYTPSGRNIQRKYELGNAEKYNQDWIDQLYGGEGFYSDSIKIDTTLTFKTLHGRTVYGGGGIVPDIFIPIDADYLTTYFIDLENDDIFNQFAFDYFDKNLHLLNEYKDFKSMLAYLESQPLLQEIIMYADKKGIRRRSHLIRRSASHIEVYTQAAILNNFFGDEAYYTTMLKQDPMIEKAIEVLTQEYDVINDTASTFGVEFLN
ncbi:carboxyl-terminal processing protease [Dysgonomonadaceae bacterium PH5-43]|nr:carboxyl-terminal processing protease [Dysgonomonadaceae bacterium PH5-43]